MNAEYSEEVKCYQRAISRLGGLAGRGESKRRGDSEYYRELQRKSTASKRRKSHDKIQKTRNS